MYAPAVGASANLSLILLASVLSVSTKTLSYGEATVTTWTIKSLEFKECVIS